MKSETAQFVGNEGKEPWKPHNFDKMFSNTKQKIECKTLCVWKSKFLPCVHLRPIGPSLITLRAAGLWKPHSSKSFPPSDICCCCCSLEAACMICQQLRADWSQVCPLALILRLQISLLHFPANFTSEAQTRSVRPLLCRDNMTKGEAQAQILWVCFEYEQHCEVLQQGLETQFVSRMGGGEYKLNLTGVGGSFFNLHGYRVRI